MFFIGTNKIASPETPSSSRSMTILFTPSPQNLTVQTRKPYFHPWTMPQQAVV